MQNFSNTSARRVMGLAAVIAVLAGTGLARAQEGDKDQGGFDQPLKGRRGQEGLSRSMMMSESDGEHTYTVKVEGDKVTGEMDGKELPSSRVRQRNGRVEILDENGDVLKTFNMRVVTPRGLGGAVQAPGWHVETLRPAQAQGGGQVWTQEAQPKAMMGVTMTDAEDGGAQIESVMDGLPAEKAGLKVGDRVVKANGKEVKGQQDLREVIRNAEPGDTITLAVDRDGKEQEIKVKLAKFDQNKIVYAAPLARQLQGGNDNLAKAREQLEKALDQLKDQKRLEGDKLEKVRDALQEALDSLEEAKAHSFRFQNDDAVRIFGREGQNFVLPQPAPAPMVVDQDMSRQLEKLNAQMEKMNKRLEELEKNRR